MMERKKEVKEGRDLTSTLSFDLQNEVSDTLWKTVDLCAAKSY